jgi:REP element-mobilizing transposase RayT/DNA-binding response OmpR family regulator
MQRAILAVSPNLQFLEQIRSHLEEGGRYRVKGVTTGGDALTLVRNSNFDLAILDAESSDVPFVPFTRDLVEIQPGLKLLVFPPQNNPHHPALTGLVANGFLKKPFFTPEVSRALTDLFKEVVPEVIHEPESTDELADLWINKPEEGISRVEQLLGSTTAKTGLLIAQGRVIAASGAAEDNVIRKVLSLLDEHPLSAQSLDLMRFINPETGDEKILMYASRLISGVTLVLFYPSTTSILLARQEVFQVKQEFKEVYPTTGQLRQDLAGITAEKSVVPVRVEEIPVPEELIIIEQTTEDTADLQDEDMEEQEPDTILSEAELNNLDAMLSEMPSPDPVSETPQPIEEINLSGWLPLESDTPVSVSNNEIESNQVLDESIFPEGFSEPISEDEQEPHPPLPPDYLNEFAPINWQPVESANEIPADATANVSSEPETAPDAAQEEESPTATSEPQEAVISFPWENEQEDIIVTDNSLKIEENAGNEVVDTGMDELGFLEEIKSEEESPAASAGEQSYAEAFNTWLDQLKDSENPPPADQIVSGPFESETLPPLPIEWQSSEEETLETPPEIDEIPASEEPVFSEEPLINEEPQAPEVEAIALESEKEPAVRAVEEFGSFTEHIYVETPTDVTVPEIPIAGNSEMQLPPPLPVEHFSSHSTAEPGTEPLGIRNFRFQYSCVLAPRNPAQFLTRDLNERLSFLLPQLHLEYGWHLTGIAIRPQYITWSISVPIETSPIKVIQEIRRRTSAHLFSNFPELNPGNAIHDFWAPGFLALSGSSRPSSGMIYDFIAQIRKNQKPGD